jgi:hypothetical protein
MKDIAYKCLRCGAINISKYDGRRCGQCQGPIAPIGEAILLDKRSGNQPSGNLKPGPPNCDTSVYPPPG